MALPITVQYTFANATTTQNLSSLDVNFATVYNAVNGIGNGTVSLSNVSITGGTINNVAIGNSTVNIGNLSLGNQTAVKGSLMKQDWLVEDGANQSKNEGLIFPTGSTYSYFTASKTFTNANSTQDGEAPNIAGFFVGYANGTDKDVVGSTSMAVALSSGVNVFASNPICRSNNGIGNARFVGMEIDVEPATGVTVNSGSAGLYINSFNYDGCGPAIQTGGIGGTFSNGVIINGVKSDGAAFSDQSGLSCKYGLFLGNGSYSDAAIYLNSLQKIRMMGNGSNVAADIYGDTGNYWNVKLNSGSLFDSSSSTENNLISAFRNSSTSSSIQIFTASGASWNGNATALKVAKNNTTNRSVNAAGTINASGADYAEYERKNNNCGIVSKGQIIGFDKNGQITDKFSESISFGVKSTNPTIVGGDDWHNIIGSPPEEPKYVELDIEKPKYPIQSIKDKSNISIEQYEFDLAKYEEKKSIHRLEWESTIYSSYQSDLNKYKENLERERQKVDRIAYCGKVPINVIGSNVGDYIIPINENNNISAISVSNPSFEQYLICVGRVRKILPDGRSEIVVKPI